VSIPDEAVFHCFLPGLFSLSAHHLEMLEVPLMFTELYDAVKQADKGCSPGIDGLPYEFYKALLSLVGLPLLEALNGMLKASELDPSLRRGVIWLIPDVAGTPIAVQLRPITLLCTDYKLLTKMLTARMLTVLPTMLLSCAWSESGPSLKALQRSF
jgi:hypothetical protein